MEKYLVETCPACGTDLLKDAIGELVAHPCVPPPVPEKATGKVATFLRTLPSPAR